MIILRILHGFHKLSWRVWWNVVQIPQREGVHSKEARDIAVCVREREWRRLLPNSSQNIWFMVQVTWFGLIIFILVRNYKENCLEEFQWISLGFWSLIEEMVSLFFTLFLNCYPGWCFLLVLATWGQYIICFIWNSSNISRHWPYHMSCTPVVYVHLISVKFVLNPNVFCFLV